MKNSKRIVSALILAVGLHLVGCGNETPVFNENGAFDNTETVEENNETTKELTESKSGVMTATDKPAETASPTQEPVSTPAPTAKPTPEPTETPQPTVPPHVHEYKVESSTEATCATAGSVVKVCECGERQTENVPATGQHNWVEGFTVIHHEALGHVSVTETQVQVGTTTRTEYECANCGARFNTPEEKTEHCKATGDFTHAMARTIAYDYSEPVFETRTESVWVVDQGAWDETVGSGTYTCTVCGATK